MRAASIIFVATACASLGACRATGSAVASAPPVPANNTSSAPIGPTTLSPTESRLRDHVRAQHQDDVTLLETAVNISSGTQNVAGVRRVGDLFASELAAMGLVVRWRGDVALAFEGGRAARAWIGAA